MSDKDKVYFYELLLNSTIEFYKEMIINAEIMLKLSPDNISMKTRIIEYNNIIKSLTTILEKLEGK